MYWVGAAGTVDPADIAEVVCSGSVLQLGRDLIISPPPVAGGGVPPPLASAEEVAEIPIPSISATVRYAVFPDTDDHDPSDTAPTLPVISGTSVSNLWLAARGRAGNGRIVADLMEIPFYLLGIGDPGTVQETSLLHFDSADFPASATFQRFVAVGGDSAEPSHVLDFDNNSYYVVVSLTAPAIETAHPPAIAALGVVQSPLGRVP